MRLWAAVYGFKRAGVAAAIVVTEVQPPGLKGPTNVSLGVSRMSKSGSVGTRPDTGPDTGPNTGDDRARIDAGPPRQVVTGVADALEDHRSTLRSYFRRRVRYGEDAEDFVQDVYLRVISAGPDPQKITSWRGFLLRAASNLLIDKYRRSEARMEGNHVAIENDLQDEGTDDPERILIGRDELHSLSEAMKILSPAARDAFLLVRVEGMSHKEAAARLGVEPKAVSRHVERSLARLAAMLADPRA